MGSSLWSMQWLAVVSRALLVVGWLSLKSDGFISVNENLFICNYYAPDYSVSQV